jgi:NADP-dependent 3-hydroxy acid dehydrogenase YdfG
MSKKLILVSGTSGGFGHLTAEALGRVDHTVYASMRDVVGRDAQKGRPRRRPRPGHQAG